MYIISKMQFKERVVGTLLRLGWIVAIVTFVPTLLYVVYGAMAVGRIIYIALLALVALMTLFLILASEEFRNAFTAESSNVLPMVQKVYQSYSALIFVLLAIGIILGVLVIIFAIKENNGRSSKKRVISSSVMMAVLIIGSIIYMASKSKIMGA